MASPVVGYAAIQIIPSMRGVHQTIQRELDRGAQQSGARAGQSIGSSLSSGLGRAMRGSMDAAYKALQTGAVAAGGVIATSLVKGWGRVTAIQDATAALTISLGDSAAAAALLDETLEVVRGTPFNLDQFASAAQQMVGMGIEAQKVPAYLEAIGEAAATQGGRATEMAGRLTTVFGQIAASGQVQLADIWRISDTGVNALGILANSFGVTRDAMKDLISQGAVPADQALDALARGILEGTDGPAGATIALAGTMDELRQSMTGAVGGVESAMSRLGAAIIAPFGPAITAGAVGFTGVLDDLTDRADDLFGALARSGPVDRFIDIMEDAPARLAGLTDLLGDIGTLAGGAAGGMAALGSGAVSSAIGTIGLAVPTLGPIPGALLGMALATPAARDALADLAGAMAPILADLGEGLLPVITAVSEAFEQILPAAIEAGGAALEAIGGAAVDVVSAVGPVAEALLDVATPVLVGALETVADLIGEHSELLIPLAGAWAGVKAAAVGAAAWEGIAAGMGTVRTAMEPLGDRFRLVSSGLREIAQGALDIPAATSRMSAGVSIGVGQIRAGFQGAMTPIKNFIGTGVSGANVLQGVMVGAGVALGVVMQGIAQAHREAQEQIDDLRTGMDVDDRSIKSLLNYQEAIGDMAVEAQFAADANRNWLGIAKGAVELLSWQENAVIDAAIAAGDYEKAYDEAEAATRRLIAAYSDVSSQIGVGVPSVERWVNALDLDPATMSVDEMADAIHEARRAAEVGDPSMDALADSFEILGDETADAEDQLKAFKAALDNIIGVNVNYEAALDNLRGSMEEFTTAWLEAIAAEEEWSTNLSGTDSASRETREMLRGMVTDATDLAVAYREQGGSLEESVGMLALARDGIIETATAAGISQEDVEEYLATLGLTPTSLETIIEANIDDESLRRSDQALALTARDRYAEIIADLGNSADNAQRRLDALVEARNAEITIDFVPGRSLVIAGTDVGVAAGGLQFRNAGGYIGGPNIDRDVVPAMLTPGEYVVRKDMVSKMGIAFFDALNAGRMPGYNTGGLVPARPMPAPAMAGGDMAPRDSRPNLTVVTQASDTAGVVSELKWQMRRGGL